jgi:hypothetical protein
MPFEGEVVNDREDSSRPSKRDGVRWDEEKVGMFTRQGRGQPDLRP